MALLERQREGIAERHRRRITWPPLPFQLWRVDCVALCLAHS